MPTSTTNQLLRRIADGDLTARDELLARHRERLRRMVALRIDPRVAARVDPSDVIQETLLEAARKLPKYLDEQPVSFYPWLRKIGWEKLIQVHRAHVNAQRRSVERESPRMALPDESVHALAEIVAVPQSSVHYAYCRKETLQRVSQALSRLKDHDREVLILKYLEQLTCREIAESLEISEAAVKMRHARALQRLQGLMSQESR